MLERNDTDQYHYFERYQKLRLPTGMKVIKWHSPVSQCYLLCCKKVGSKFKESEWNWRRFQEKAVDFEGTLRIMLSRWHCFELCKTLTLESIDEIL